MVHLFEPFAFEELVTHGKSNLLIKDFVLLSKADDTCLNHNFECGRIFKEINRTQHQTWKVSVIAVHGVAASNEATDNINWTNHFVET